MITVETIKRKAAPTGAVVVSFRRIAMTLRYNAGGANDGWWWDGRKIPQDEARGILAQRVVEDLQKL